MDGGELESMDRHKDSGIKMVKVNAGIASPETILGVLQSEVDRLTELGKDPVTAPLAQRSWGRNCDRSSGLLNDGLNLGPVLSRGNVRQFLLVVSSGNNGAQENDPLCQ